MMERSVGGIQGKPQGKTEEGSVDQTANQLIVDDGINRMVDDGAGVVNQNVPFGAPMLRQQPKEE